ncbi:erythromycin esterase family protein [Phototrophicus methaneseepsis]|uniref:Erythromycin esterase family protein n=2 Tax=Phototrophicus methaneseepsis TaxID=2710758 RepID=A0A7S8EE12_9CHLR|nr:erythromycin esterase family protein [Phototrophicus methaneseepsis]
MIQTVGSPLQVQADLDPLMEEIGDAHLVLLGEATHGTSEYYLWRKRLSQRLIQEKGFSFIAVEGDWPDCYKVNRYIKGYENAGENAYHILHAFKRWPTWMWANWEVVALVEWLRQYNDQAPEPDQVGFYGLDVYSLWESLSEVTRYLTMYEPDALHTAYQAYQCFQPYDEDVQSYARATRLIPTSCESEVVDLLVAMQRKGLATLYDGDREAQFNAQQNAHVAVGAERYYRTMVRGDAESWNVRDHHMVDTLERLLNYYGDNTKAIIWAHNTHIGDARATPMAQAGIVNVGQLVRERLGKEGVVLVGSGSYEGHVIAGRYWDADMEEMPIVEAAGESWEGVLHETFGEDTLLIFSKDAQARELLEQVRGHRAIGVVYDPYSGRRGGFVPTALSRRYDAFLYLQETEALHPLHLQPETTQPPETYPWGV